MSGIDSIEINKFRGLQDIKLDKLGHINLLVGDNNAGKTSILEAIELLSDPLSERNFRMVSRMRDRFMYMRSSLSYVDSAIWLFPGEIDSEQRIELIAKQGNENYKLKLKGTVKSEFRHIPSPTNNEDIVIEDEEDEIEVKTLFVDAEYNEYQNVTYQIGDVYDRESNLYTRERQETPRAFHTEFISSIDHRMRPITSVALNTMIKNDDRPKMLQLLQKFDPEIEHIELLLQGSGRFRNDAVPYIKHHKLGLAPVVVFGDGLRKAITLTNAIIRAKGGILLVDEVETGVHTSMLNTFFQWLVEACREYDVQLFATTHSLEAVDAMLLANEKTLQRFSLYRFSNDSKKKVKYFSGDSVYQIRQLLGQDVR